MKHFHLTMVVIAIVLFIWQSQQALSKKRPFGKKIKIGVHVAYALLIISGALTVMPLLSLDVDLQWVIAKTILLVAAISASMKSFTPKASLTQARMGVFIASIAYAGIILLAYWKPENFI